ncbi:MAG: flagellar hook-length control protein FliK, partial [Synergistaceae bacterium]|nr:flagellar hook-length control protein FliK [Synergistaceae bacterium]
NDNKSGAEAGDDQAASRAKSQQAKKTSAADAKAQHQESETKGDLTAPKGTFANEMAAALRDKAQGAFETQTGVPATRPGMTYTLNADNAFGDGVRSVLEFMRSDGINEARIVVEPPSLGRVDVSLQAGATGIDAVFKVDNEALKQMLQQQLDVLKDSLQAQGIHVSSLAVDIKNRDDQKGRGDLYETKKTRRVGGVSEIEDEPQEETRLARLDLEKGLLHWVA